MSHYLCVIDYKSFLVSINRNLWWLLFGNKLFLEIMKLNLKPEAPSAGRLTMLKYLFYFSSIFKNKKKLANF